jgi:hypothetical protein
MMTIDQVEPIIRSLSEDLQRQALQQIEDLNYVQQQRETQFSFDWVGELEDDNPSISTVELQHKIHALQA